MKVLQQPIKIFKKKKKKEDINHIFLKKIEKR